MIGLCLGRPDCITFSFFLFVLFLNRIPKSDECQENERGMGRVKPGRGGLVGTGWWARLTDTVGRHSRRTQLADTVSGLGWQTRSADMDGRHGQRTRLADTVGRHGWLTRSANMVRAPAEAATFSLPHWAPNLDCHAGAVFHFSQYPRIFLFTRSGRTADPPAPSKVTRPRGRIPL